MADILYAAHCHEKEKRKSQGWKREIAMMTLKVTGSSRSTFISGAKPPERRGRRLKGGGEGKKKQEKNEGKEETYRPIGLDRHKRIR